MLCEKVYRKILNEIIYNTKNKKLWKYEYHWYSSNYLARHVIQPLMCLKRSAIYFSLHWFVCEKPHSSSILKTNPVSITFIRSEIFNSILLSVARRSELIFQLLHAVSICFMKNARRWKIEFQCFRRMKDNFWNCLDL